MTGSRPQGSERHRSPHVVRPPSNDRSANPPVTAREAVATSYYGVPVVHKPHWKWLIIVYFFLGGIAGAAHLLAAIADLVGPREDRRIVRVGRYVSFAAFVPTPVLLILDLGRPERFYLMLRVLKLRSPMSLGTWALTAFGVFSAFAATAQAAEDGLIGEWLPYRPLAERQARILAALGSPFALFVAGYTGVLLAATAVPLWTKRAFLLGPLFVSSALSNAVSAIVLVLGLARGTRPETLRRLEQLEAIAVVTEMGILAAWLVRLGPTARPLIEDSTGLLLRHGTVGGGLALPLALQAASTRLPNGSRRGLRLFASALVLAGGFILRYAVVVAGRASADDPRATFDLTAGGLRQESRSLAPVHP